MLVLKTGDPCPCCGRPIKYTDPDALRLLAQICEMMGVKSIRAEIRAEIARMFDHRNIKRRKETEKEGE